MIRKMLATQTELGRKEALLTLVDVEIWTVHSSESSRTISSFCGRLLYQSVYVKIIRIRILWVDPYNTT